MKLTGGYGLDLETYKRNLERDEKVFVIAFSHGAHNIDFGIVTKNLKSRYFVQFDGTIILRTTDLKRAIDLYNEKAYAYRGL